jgi:SAM-dependent methyltransferase
VNLFEIAPGLRLGADGLWSTPDVIETAYPDYGHDHCYSVEDVSLWFAHRNRVISAAVQRHEPPGASFFDVGAGNGYVSAALQQAGFAVLAIEPNRIGAARALQRGVESVVCGQLPSPAFRPAVADAIGLFDVVEHIEHDQDYLASLRPYLKPGGRLYATVPAYPWLWSSNDSASGHFRRYTLTGLRQVVESAGYQLDYGTYFFSWLPLPIFVLRTLASLGRPKRSPGRERSAAQHGAGAPRLRRFAQRALAFEARRVAAGGTLPFGASCLIVARRR